MIGCESAPVEGTVPPQGLNKPEGEMGLLPGRTCSRIIRGDESGIRLFGSIRKRIEGGNPRISQVAGDGFMIKQLARRFSDQPELRVPLLCSWIL